MPEYTINIDSLPGVGSEELLERFAEAMQETAALGPSTSLNTATQTLGATFQIEQRDSRSASAIALLLFTAALREAGVPEELADVGRLLIERDETVAA